MVLLGNGVWKSRYGSDPGVIGRAVRINDVPAVVIGVMPEGFKFPQNADLWQPLSQMPKLEQQTRNVRPTSRCSAGCAPGRHARAGAGRDARDQPAARRDYPDTNKDIEAKVQTFNERQNGGPIRAVFLSLLGAVAFVLLIACANVANLLLARAATARARCRCASRSAPRAAASCGNC